MKIHFDHDQSKMKDLLSIIEENLINSKMVGFYQKEKQMVKKKIKDWVDPNVPGEIIPYSANYERDHLDEGEEDKRTMVPKIIKAGCMALDLIYFFTAGHDEVRC